MVIVVLAVAIVTRNLYSTRGAPYVFSPCPGLTVTSLATTGIWNCSNLPVTTGPTLPFTAGEFVTIKGIWVTGYVALGCVSQSGESSCAVPQIASLRDYVHADIGGGVWFVVQWKQGTEVDLQEGLPVTISGTLQGITYSSNPGSTYPIYHENNQTASLLQPQPSFEIMNAVLS
jgi:hypothetical protein